MIQQSALSIISLTYCMPDWPASKLSSIVMFALKMRAKPSQENITHQKHLRCNVWTDFGFYTLESKVTNAEKTFCWFKKWKGWVASYLEKAWEMRKKQQHFIKINYRFAFHCTIHFNLPTDICVCVFSFFPCKKIVVQYFII